MLHSVFQIQKAALLATPDSFVKTEVKSLLTPRKSAIKVLFVLEEVEGPSQLTKSLATSAPRVGGAPLVLKRSLCVSPAISVFSKPHTTWPPVSNASPVIIAKV